MTRQAPQFLPPADDPPPLVVWVHGGAWLFGDRRHLPETLCSKQLFDALAAAGLAVATVDYRHARESPFPAQLQDVQAAIRYLRLHADVLGVDVGRVGVWGESAGGHLAALVGLGGGADAVVDWYGVADPDTIPRLPLPGVDHPPDVLLAGADAAMHDADARVRQVRPGAPPFLLVHGTADRVVPFAQSRLLPGRPGRGRRIRGAGAGRGGRPHLRRLQRDRHHRRPVGLVPAGFALGAGPVTGTGV